MGTLIEDPSIDWGNLNWSRRSKLIQGSHWFEKQSTIEKPCIDRDTHLGTETGQQSMNNLCTRIGKFLQRQQAQIRIISSHGYFNMSFSSLLCLLWSTSSAVTSHLGTSIGNLTATDRRMIIIDCLFLLIDHLSYFVCQELEFVTLLEFPLAFYGSTYQTSSSARCCSILQIHAATPTYRHISTPTWLSFNTTYVCSPTSIHHLSQYPRHFQLKCFRCLLCLKLLTLQCQPFSDATATSPSQTLSSGFSHTRLQSQAEYHPPGIDDASARTVVSAKFRQMEEWWYQWNGRVDIVMLELGHVYCISSSQYR